MARLWCKNIRSIFSTSSYGIFPQAQALVWVQLTMPGFKCSLCGEPTFRRPPVNQCAACRPSRRGGEWRDGGGQQGGNQLVPCGEDVSESHPTTPCLDRPFNLQQKHTVNPLSEEAT